MASIPDGEKVNYHKYQCIYIAKAMQRASSNRGENLEKRTKTMTNGKAQKTTTEDSPQKWRQRAKRRHDLNRIPKTTQPKQIDPDTKERDQPSKPKMKRERQEQPKEKARKTNQDKQWGTEKPLKRSKEQREEETIQDTKPKRNPTLFGTLREIIPWRQSLKSEIE